MREIHNEHGQLMGTIEPTSINMRANFLATSEHNMDSIATLTEGAARFWLWLLDERFRSIKQRSR